MPPAESGPEELQAAWVGVAIADSLELREVSARVADACRVVLPLDGVGVSQVTLARLPSPIEEHRLVLGS
jgi:hypothetical protein